MKFPCWFDKRVLRAEDLIDLETYVFLRAGQCGPPEHGVVWMNLAESVSFSVDEEETKVSLCQISGVAPSGRPIVIQGQSIQHTFQTPESTSFVVDLYVATKTDTTPPKQTDEEQKVSVYSYLVSPPNEGAGSQVAKSKERLFLGRYSYDAGKLTCIQRPWVYTLGGLEPYDEDWRKWVHPIQEEIKQALDFSNVSQSFHQAIIYSEIHRLAQQWYQMPIQQLALHLRHLQRMNENTGDIAHPRLGDARGGYVAIEVKESSQDLPLRLIKLWKPKELPKELGCRRLDQTELSFDLTGSHIQATFNKDCSLLAGQHLVLCSLDSSRRAVQLDKDGDTEMLQALEFDNQSVGDIRAHFQRLQYRDFHRFYMFVKPSTTEQVPYKKGDSVTIKGVSSGPIPEVEPIEIWLVS